MSTVPATLDALITVFRAKTVQVQVIDGPTPGDVAGDVIAVGYALDDVAVLDALEEIRGLAVVGESFDVMCLARSWSGNRSVSDQRVRSYGIVAQVKNILRLDPTLGGVVARARFAGSTYRPWITDQTQLVVDVPFRVQVNAFVTPQ